MNYSVSMAHRSLFLRPMVLTNLNIDENHVLDSTDCTNTHVL